MKKTKLRNTRPKAPLGALISAGLGLTGSIINAIGSARQSKSDAEAIEAQTRAQTDMITGLNENNNNLQQQLIASQKEQNQRMIDAYTNAAIQQGQLNVNNRYRAGRIQVKKGGKLRNMHPSLRAGNNNVEVEGGELIITPDYVPQATDGGSVIPIGQTQDGNIISIAVGPSHDEKHKSINGKIEGGVGINVNDETAVLSRRTHDGFNPVEAVAQGMTPEDAFKIQETNKIMDRVNYKTPVGKRKLRYGGRPKAANGNFWNTPLGATAITGGANTLGWLATTLGNISAANKQKAAVNRAADTMINAYNRLSGVDLNQLNGVYRHGIAALQDSSTITGNAEKSNIERSLQRNLRSINNGRLSSAAAQNLSAVAETNAQDMISNVESEVAKRRQAINDANQNAINEMTRTNLTIDNQRAAALADLLKYNSEVRNESILGAGQADANRHTQLGQIRGQRDIAIWSGLGNVPVNTGQTYQNQVNAYNQNKFNTLAALAGATQKETANRVIKLLRQFGINV